MYEHIVVEQVRQFGQTSRIEACRRSFSLADDDTAAQSSAVGVDPVVGHFHVVSPTVEEDTSAALGTVGEAQAIDARRVAQEVGRVKRRFRIAIAQTIVVTIVRGRAGEAVERNAIGIAGRVAVSRIVVL